MQLSELRRKYAQRGFQVLGFPSDDFRQEKGTNEEIKKFVSTHFPNADFPIFAKGSLRKNLIYMNLQMQTPGKTVKGNFFKYLVDRRGLAVAIYNKEQDPFSFEDDIAKLLDAELI